MGRLQRIYAIWSGNLSWHRYMITDCKVQWHRNQTCESIEKGWGSRPIHFSGCSFHFSNQCTGTAFSLRIYLMCIIVTSSHPYRYPVNVLFYQDKWHKFYRNMQIVQIVPKRMLWTIGSTPHIYGSLCMT